jgi:Domain of unknown function (DUF4468) with TBP-like fold
MFAHRSPRPCSGLLLFLLVLRLGLPAEAQTAPLPTDSLRGKVAYQGVVAVPGISADALYGRARGWLARYLEASAVTLADPVGGQLVAHYHSVYTKRFLLGRYPMDVWRTLTISVREGRYRYEMTDFTARNVLQSYDYYGLEAPAVQRELGPYVRQVAAQELATLAAAMQAPAAHQEKPW